jgi:hypothetical protein
MQMGMQTKVYLGMQFSFGTSPSRSSTMYFLGVMVFAILSPPENFLVAEI